MLDSSTMWRAIAMLLWLGSAAPSPAVQPDTASLRKLFEDALVRRTQQFGDSDARTAQAARDLGLFLVRAGDTANARRAMANTVRIDEKAFGPKAAETLEDVASLATVSPRTETEALLRRAAESPDAMVAGPALTSLAEMRKSAGDASSAAALLRRALEKAEAVDGKDGVTVALMLNALALVVPASEGVPLLQRALAIDQQKLGERDAQTLRDVRKLASLLRATGHATEALALERRFNVAPR